MLHAFDDLRPGMRTAADVHSRHGALLIPAGVELNQRHLALLERSGVEHVDIQPPPEEQRTAPPVSPEALARAEAQLAPRFAHCDRAHPAMAALVAHATLRLAQVEGSS